MGPKISISRNKKISCSKTASGRESRGMLTSRLYRFGSRPLFQLFVGDVQKSLFALSGCRFYLRFWLPFQFAVWQAISGRGILTIDRIREPGCSRLPEGCFVEYSQAWRFRIMGAPTNLPAAPPLWVGYSGNHGTGLWLGRFIDYAGLNG